MPEKYNEGTDFGFTQTPMQDKQVVDRENELQQRAWSTKKAAQPTIVEAAKAAQSRCSSCDGTGDLVRADGEWLGYCTCESGQWAAHPPSRLCMCAYCAPSFDDDAALPVPAVELPVVAYMDDNGLTISKKSLDNNFIYTKEAWARACTTELVRLSDAQAAIAAQGAKR